MKTARFLGIALAALMATGASAQEAAWDDIRAALFGERALQPAGETIAIDAPYRSSLDSRTPIGATLTAPEGRRIGKAMLILDENPMPVSAVFDFARPLPAFRFQTTMRVNGPTPLHIVMETTDGGLYVAEGFVKTSGQGACAAPPGTDPAEALKTLGRIDIRIGELRLDDPLNPEREVAVDILHPSHSGMQMDQISLLFIPMRYVEKVDIDLDGKGFVEVTGSISLSENPGLSLSVPGDTSRVGVTMTDTDGTVSRAEKSIAGF